MKFNDYSKTIIKELDSVFKKIDITQLEKFKDMIRKSNRIFLLGVGREGMSTRAFAMRLMHLGKEAHWIWDDTTPNIDKDDLVIITSGSGEIGHLHYVAQKAKSAGATLVVVTGTPDRKTPLLADHVIWIPACVYNGKDNVVPSIQPMGNLFEQSLLITFDIIVMMLSKEINISYEKMSNRHRNVE